MRSTVHPSLGGRTTLRADVRGLQVQARDFEVRVALRGFGRVAAPLAPSPVLSDFQAATATAPRVGASGASEVVYTRAGHEEFFRLRAGGLEHGAVVQERPSGDGWLRAEVSFDGLTPVLREGRVWLLDASGVERASYSDLHAFDADGQVLGTHLSVTDTQRVALDVEDAGARYPVTIDPILWGTETITGSVDGCGAASSGFGEALALVGPQMAVGAPAACTDGVATGAVVVFDRPASLWLENAVLVRPSAAGADRFGARVALSADTLVASAPGADGGVGAVEVFVRLGRRFHAVTTLGLSVDLTSSATTALGSSLAVDANTIVAGAPGANDGAGAAVVYQRGSDGTWAPLQSLSVVGTAGLGGALALSESFLALAAEDSVELFDRRSSTDPFVLAASLPLGAVVDLAVHGDGFVAAVGNELRFIDHDAAAPEPWSLGATTSAADGSALSSLAADAEGVAIAGSAGAAFYLDVEGTYETDGTITGSTTSGLSLALDGQTLYVGDAGERVLVHRRVASAGEPCTAGSQCDSGFCVDGVCCNTACGLGEVDCLACSVTAGSATDGVCGTARAGATCRPAVGSCDAAELCDGASPACRSDRLVPAGTTCRATAGPCDVSEVCGGTSPFCPTDRFQSVGQVCRSPQGDCDVAEACDGFRAACPDDRFATAGRMCRPRAGACDVEESCDGATPACPRDGYKRFGTVCRPPTSNCDAAERCSGTNDVCPVNEAQPDGTACADGDACTEGDMCQAGQCVSGPRMCVAPAPTPTMSSSSGCSVNQAPSAGTTLWGWMPLLGLLLLAARRRRARRSTIGPKTLAAVAALLAVVGGAPAQAHAQDSDGDTVPDAMDVCPGGDDRVDFDADGTPADCDCDDGSASTRPGAPEVCDGADNDCDGFTDASLRAGGTPSEMIANVGSSAVSLPTSVASGEVAWTSTYFATGTVRYSQAQPHAAPGVAQSLDMVIEPSSFSQDAIYGFFDGSRFIGLRVAFVSNQGARVALARGNATDQNTGGIFGSLGPIGRYQGTVPGYTHTLPSQAVHFTLRLNEDGTQSVWVSGADGDSVVLPLPASSYLNVATAWRMWVVASTRLSATYSAGVRVLETLPDADSDLVCDALDVCPEASDLQDADGDGVPDACDVCVGANGADNDADGVPFPCDCDDSDPMIHPAAEDVCDGRDNNCDGAIDVGTLLSARGNDLLYRLAAGQAAGVETVEALPTFRSQDGGSAVRASLPSTAGSWAIYYRETLANNTTASDPNRVRVLVDRETRTDDHDFIVALSDGSRVFGLQIGDVGGDGESYTVAPFVGADDVVRVDAPTFPDASRVEARFPLSDASPYTFEFVFGADPRIEVTTAAGARGVVRMTPGEVGAVNVRSLQLLLAANQASETFVIRTIEVTQGHMDEDEDGVCDAIDRCPGLDDTGPDQDSDGIPDACDICTGGPDDQDGDSDGVPDACDACPGFMDAEDRDNDSLPDGCDTCPDDAANDYDNDGVCDMSDVCLLGPDDADADSDGIPDACDLCPVDGLGDSDEDGTCDAGDVCLGDDRRGDRDGDGFCADIDCDDTRASIHPGADEVCDGYDSNCDGVLPMRELDNNGNQRIDCRDGGGCAVDPVDASHVPWWSVALAACLVVSRLRRFRP